MSRMLHFSRADMWVTPQCLLGYTRWVWQRHRQRGEGARGIGQYFWVPSVRLPSPEAAGLLRRAAACGVQPAWLRGHSDGTRVQVFDRRGDRVCQLAVAPAGRRALRRELWARVRAAGLAPRILRRAPDNSGYVEESIHGGLLPYRSSVLDEVVGLLKKQFYRTRPIALPRYIRILSRYGPLHELDHRALRAARRVLGEAPVPCTWVHGDLWAGNVLQDAGGAYRLLDWEYTRACAASADAWYYVYHQHCMEGRNREGFHSSLGEMFQRLWGISDQRQVQAWHLLHLVERQVFLRGLGTSQPSLARLEADLRSAAQ